MTLATAVKVELCLGLGLCTAWPGAMGSTALPVCCSVVTEIEPRMAGVLLGGHGVTSRQDRACVWMAALLPAAAWPCGLALVRGSGGGLISARSMAALPSALLPFSLLTLDADGCVADALVQWKQ
eukprot:2320736-Amphidinium_carterae.1